jgi:hypothetical protein
MIADSRGSPLFDRRDHALTDHRRSDDSIGSPAPALFPRRSPSSHCGALASPPQCEVLERLAGLDMDRDREVADGMVFTPLCFNESPANKLTNPMLDPYGKILSSSIARRG